MNETYYKLCGCCHKCWLKCCVSFTDRQIQKELVMDDSKVLLLPIEINGNE